MVEKDRKTFLVIFESAFREHELDRTKFLIFDTPSAWDKRMLNLFIENHVKELGLYHDHRSSIVFELTSQFDENKLNEVIQIHRPYVNQDIVNTIDTYVKIKSMDNVEICKTPYIINGFKDRHKPTSIIHVVNYKKFNKDTKDVDETIQRYIMTSNTVTSFNLITPKDDLSGSLKAYTELIDVNDITLVFHNSTIDEILSIIREAYKLYDSGITYNLDLFGVDLDNNVYQIILYDDGFKLQMCNTREDD